MMTKRAVGAIKQLIPPLSDKVSWARYTARYASESANYFSQKIVYLNLTQKHDTDL